MSEYRKIEKLETELGRLVYEISILEEEKARLIERQNPLRQRVNEIATQLKALKKKPDSGPGGNNG